MGARVRARLVLDLLSWRFPSEFEVVGAYDDALEKGSVSPSELAILGSIEDALGHAGDDEASYLLTLGAPSSIRAIGVLRSLDRSGIQILSLVPDPGLVSPSARLGKNVVLMPGVFVGPGAEIGDLVFMHGGVTIEHEVTVGDNVMIAPGVSVASSVVVGDHSFVGVGTSIAPGVEIGKGCLIGAGSLVLHSVPDHSVAYGSPARRMREVSEGMDVPTRRDIKAASEGSQPG